jgi:hypothetical protein
MAYAAAMTEQNMQIRLASRPVGRRGRADGRRHRRRGRLGGHVWNAAFLRLNAYARIPVFGMLEGKNFGKLIVRV